MTSNKPAAHLFLLVLTAITVSFKAFENTGDTGEKAKISLIPSGEKYFEQYQVKGAFMMYDLEKNEYTANDTSYFSKEFLPASTYKIFNSLVALETGVISNENVIFKWDGKERMSPAWNKDTDLKDAFKNSTVWYYQELARRIGAERMQQYLDKAGYGNRNISGGIDQFWLNGGLRITPMQQVDLLKRLYKNQLPFSQRTMDIVKSIMITEQTEQYTLRAKTGWAYLDQEDIGWYVGYLEKNNNVYFFATLIESKDKSNQQFAKSRIEITKSILKDLGLY